MVSARHIDNHFFWALAQISYDLVPHAAQFKARGFGIPAVFIQCAQGSLPVAKKQLSQEMLQMYCNKLETICGKSDVLPARFKFSCHLQQLLAAAAKYQKYIREKNTQRQESTRSESAPQMIRAAYVVPASMKSLSSFIEGEQLSIAKITDAVSGLQPFEFKRVDHLLFTNTETIANASIVNPRNPKHRRITKIFSEVLHPRLTLSTVMRRHFAQRHTFRTLSTRRPRLTDDEADRVCRQSGGAFPFRGYLFRYDAGPHLGGYWNFFCHLPSSTNPKV